MRGTHEVGIAAYVTPRGGQSLIETLLPPDIGTRCSGTSLRRVTVAVGLAGTVTTMKASKKLEAGNLAGAATRLRISPGETSVELSTTAMAPVTLVPARSMAMISASMTYKPL